MQKFYWPSRGQTNYQTSLGHTAVTWKNCKEREFTSGIPTLCFPVNTSSNTVSSVKTIDGTNGRNIFTCKDRFSEHNMQIVKSSDAVSTSSIQSVAPTEGLSVSNMQSVTSTGGISVSIKSDQSRIQEKRPGRHTVVLLGGKSNQVKKSTPRQGNKTWTQNTYKQAQYEYGLPHGPQRGERKSVWSIDYSKHDYENISDIASSHSKLEDRLSITSSENDRKEREPENQTRKTPRSQKRPKGPRTVLRSKSCERMGTVILDNLSCMARSGRSSPVEMDPYLKEHEKVRLIFSMFIKEAS